MSTPFKPKVTAEIGIIGGSGVYGLVENFEEIRVETPFGAPSDKIAVGNIYGKKVAFLPRHGKQHSLPPHQINYRANIWSLYSLGVKEIITAHAAGSLQKEIKPGSIIVLDQFIDRTSGRKDTFFDGPITTHVSTAFPYCERLRNQATKAAKKLKLRIHSQGTVVVISGPRFSTAAESLWFTKMGWDVVNMTQYPEVTLARELQICYCALAFPTDYDSGLVLAGKIRPVSAREVAEVFGKNIDKAKSLILEMVKNWPREGGCECQRALGDARF